MNKIFLKKAFLGTATILALGGGLMATTYNSTTQAVAETISPPAIAPVSFAELAERLLPTVVNISSTGKLDPGENTGPNIPDFPDGSPFEDFFEEFSKRHNDQIQAIPPTSLGSGFIIDAEKGLIVTNNHVIKDAQEIRVTLHDNAIVQASIIGKDEKTDIALLQADLKGHNAKAAGFGNSDIMRVGDWVMAIGNPFGLGGTVTAGIVSARKRDINAGPYDDFIQTDASINRGNSGGPMFNLRGEVIGINTAIFSPSGGSVGIGFAIPSAMANPIIDQLQKYGKTRRGWLGVRIQTVTEDIAESLGLKKEKGALVASLTATGPAEKSGFKAGDIILKFNNKDVEDMRALPRIVAETEIGKSVPVVVWRNGKEANIDVTIGELEVAEEKGLIDSTPTPGEEPETQYGELIPELDVKLMSVTADIRGQYNLSSDTNGMIVMDVLSGSDAGRKGLSEGDLIVEMNQKQVKSLTDVKAVIKDAQTQKKSSVLMLINRQGDIQFIAVKLKDDTEKTDKPKTETK